MKNNFKPIFKYIKIIIKHKWFIFISGRRLKVSLWRLIKHDLSKFRWSELTHYARRFYGDNSDPDGFTYCWIRHQNRNDHHWEYWIIRRPGDKYNPIKNIKPLEIPDQSVREMIADWLAAGRAYIGEWPNPNNWQWLSEQWDRMYLHPNTSRKIIGLIKEYREKYYKNDYKYIK